MFVGFLAFGVIVGISSLKRSIKLLVNFRINLKVLIFLSLAIFSSVLYLSKSISIPYISRATGIDSLLQKTEISTKGTASWPKWTVAKTPTELLYKGPIRSIYFLFSPFPWDIKATKHLIGLFDAFLYICLTFLILRNLKVIWRDPVLRIILIILLCYIFVFGIGVGNFGTGIRHRAKFTIMFILLAAPLLKRLIFFKKNDKN